MRSTDRLLGAVTLLVGLVVVILTLSFPPAPGNHPGPAFFPRVIGVLLCLVGAFVAIRPAGAQDTLRVTDDDTKPRCPPGALLRCVEVIGCGIFYLLLAEALGFLLVATLITMFLMLRLGNSLRLTALVAIPLVIGTYVLFHQVLQVQIPRGPF